MEAFEQVQTICETNSLFVGELGSSGADKLAIKNGGSLRKIVVSGFG